VDELIAVVHKIGAHAERRVERELIADLRQVAGKTGLLFRLAEAALDHPDGIVAEVLYPVSASRPSRTCSASTKPPVPLTGNTSSTTCAPRTAATTAGCCPSCSPR